MTDSTDEESPACRDCGDPVTESTDRRVVPTVEDGTAMYAHFCDDGCLESWEQSNS
ncbi:hypothetical protein ACLI4Z_00120 [Natrialbaceae archaeon A-arb3/5]